MLVNVAAYVIPGCVCVCVCVVRSKQERKKYFFFLISEQNSRYSNQATE